MTDHDLNNKSVWNVNVLPNSLYRYYISKISKNHPVYNFFFFKKPRKRLQIFLCCVLIIQFIKSFKHFYHIMHDIEYTTK